MQPISPDVTRSLLQIQPFILPIVREQRLHQRELTSYSKNKKFKLTVAVLFTAILCSGVGMEGVKGFGRYIRSLRWTPLPVGVGVAVIAIQKYKHLREREDSRLANEGLVSVQMNMTTVWQVRAYKMLPLRQFSRLWGYVNDIHLPIWCRKVVLSSYINTFGCNMSEAEEEDVLKYDNLGSLFRRSLKASARPIDPKAAVTSPVDGTVLAAGPVKCGTLHQVKGVTYSLFSFLGPHSWLKGSFEYSKDAPPESADTCYHKNCLNTPEKSDLYQMVVYLAPGDYHRFHSPANWKVNFRRHFPGDLLSVNPSLASWLPDLFVLNERVAYVGEWAGGFCSLTAVGATNVGSIKVYKDEKLRTNMWRKHKNTYFDKSFSNSLELSKGDPFGEFNLGSTVVLIIEVPKDGTVIECKEGDKVKVGQPLISISKQS